MFSEFKSKYDRLISRKNFTRLGQALFEICNSYFGLIKNL